MPKMIVDWNTITNFVIDSFVGYGIPREDAVRAATYNPARQLGCLDEVGSIRDGKQADFVICDAELNRREVWLAGEKLA